MHVGSVNETLAVTCVGPGGVSAQPEPMSEASPCPPNAGHDFSWNEPAAKAGTMSVFPSTLSVAWPVAMESLSTVMML